MGCLSTPTNSYQSLLELVGKKGIGSDVLVHLTIVTITLHLSPTAIADIALQGVGLIAEETGSRRLPHGAIDGAPSCTKFFQFPVLENNVVAVNVDDIEENARRPGGDSTTGTERLETLTLHEGVGTWSGMSYGKVVDAMFGIAALEEGLLTQRQEGTATEASNLGDRLQGLTVLHSNLLGRFLDDDSRTREMTEVYHSHPAVLSVSNIDAIPAMVLIHTISMVIVRRQREVLNATLSDDARLFVNDGLCPTPLLFDSTGDRSVERHLAATNSLYRAVPAEVDIPWVPRPVAHTLAAAKRGTA